MATANFEGFGTISIDASTTTAHRSFLTEKSIQAIDALVSNPGTVPVFVIFGHATQTAVVPTTEKAGMYCIPPNGWAVFPKGIGNEDVAAITASGTATIYITAGQGS